MVLHFIIIFLDVMVLNEIIEQAAAHQSHESDLQGNVITVLQKTSH